MATCVVFSSLSLSLSLCLSHAFFAPANPSNSPSSPRQLHAPLALMSPHARSTACPRDYSNGAVDGDDEVDYEERALALAAVSVIEEAVCTSGAMRVAAGPRKQSDFFSRSVVITLMFPSFVSIISPADWWPFVLPAGRRVHACSDRVAAQLCGRFTGGGAPRAAAHEHSH